VEGRLLLDVVVAERTAILELLSSEDEALLVRGNTAHKGRMSALHTYKVHGVVTQTLPYPDFWP
jgi:hypothetical protein